MKKTKLQRIAIVGASTLGKMIEHHAVNDAGIKVVGYYDDFIQEKDCSEITLLGNIPKVISDYQSNLFDAVIIGIGYSQMSARKHTYNILKGKVPLANIIHSSAYIDSSCILGEGIVILPGVILDYDVVIKDNVLINTGSLVAHHSKIEENSFIAPGVKIAGYVTVESESFIGIGATIIDMINILKNSIIGAGALVIKDTKENSLSVGVPSKIIKYNIKEANHEKI